MRLTIKLKLAAVFSIIIALSAASAWLSISNIGSLNSQIAAIVDGPVVRLERAQRMSTEVMRLVRSEKNFTLSGNKDDLEKFEKEVTAVRQGLISQMETAEGLAPPENKRSWADARAAMVQMGIQQDRIRNAVLQGEVAEARRISINDVAKFTSEINAAMAKLVELNRGQLHAAKQEADAQYNHARTVLIAMIASSLSIAVIAAFWMAISISRALARAGELTEAVANGDLTRTVENVTRDEVGDLVMNVNKMVERLRGVVGDALSASDNVSSGSQQLSSASEQVSQGATEQAAAAEEASASMEEMAANIKQNADNAAQTEKIARQSSRDAEASGEAVTRAVGEGGWAVGAQPFHEGWDAEPGQARQQERRPEPERQAEPEDPAGHQSNTRSCWLIGMPMPPDRGAMHRIECRRRSARSLRTKCDSSPAQSLRLARRRAHGA